MTSQNTIAFASENDAFANDTTSNYLVREFCPDASIMQHARPVDLERPFYLDRISVILKHNYSVNHYVNKNTLLEQTIGQAGMMFDTMSDTASLGLKTSAISGWRCSHEVFENPRINESAFNQILRVQLEYPSVQSVVDAVELWKSSPMVLTALPAYQYEVVMDEDATNLQWNLERSNVWDAHLGITRGTGVSVGIMEGGSIQQHNNFGNPVVPGNNFAAASDHAMSTAGIIGGSHLNFGIAPQVTMSSLSANGNDILFGQTIDFANDEGIQVINASFHWAVGGNPAPGNAERQGHINRFNGVFVASAGNRGQNFDTNPQFPGGYDNVIPVGAVDRRGNRGWYIANGNHSSTVANNNFGNNVPIFATSGAQSAGLNNTVRHYGGTSCAAPVVAILRKCNNNTNNIKINIEQQSNSIICLQII